VADITGIFKNPKQIKLNLCVIESLLVEWLLVNQSTPSGSFLW